MKIIYKNTFFKDLKKVDKNILIKLNNIIWYINKVSNIGELDIVDLEKLKWFKSFYRIRIWDYRVWIKINNNKIFMLRLLHRKDVYKKFP